MASFDIFITHVPSNTTISFRPFLTSFSDNFKSDWNQSYVMGRMDSIPTFKRTTRVINMAFDVPADNVDQGRVQLNNAGKLAKFLYPVYKQVEIQRVGSKTAPDENSIPTPGITNPQQKKLFQKLAAASTLEEQLNLRPFLRTMSSSPIIAINFSNLVSGPNGLRLFGFLEGFNFKPDIEAGFFTECDTGNLIPKAFSVDLTFNVIHTEPLGWDSDDIDLSNVANLKESQRLNQELEQQMKQISNLKLRDPRLNANSQPFQTGFSSDPTPTPNPGFGGLQIRTPNEE